MFSVPIQLDEESGDPLHEQIFRAFEKAILAGNGRGAKLPSVRGLAARLSVSPSTVTAAYRVLVARHLVEAAPRSGYVVASGSRGRDPELPLFLDKIEPNLRWHPVADFGRLAAEIAETDLSSGGYEEYRGNRRLREQLACLGKEAGFAADPELNVLVTAGAQQAIALSAGIFGPGARVAIEDPTYPGARIAFQRAGCTITAVPSGKEGPDLAALEKISASIDVLYCCPTYGNPQGYSWSVKTRERVAALAKRKGFVVIEDDFLGDLDYLDERLPRLKALAPQAKIIHIRTFSKCLLPALRIAGVTADPKTIDLLLKQKIWSDITGSALLQRSLAAFLERGLYREHLVRARPFYQKLREAFRAELAAGWDGPVFGDPPAGLCFLGRLPAGVDGTRFVSECRALGIVPTAGREYFLSPERGSSFFRIGFGGLEPEDAPRVAKILRFAFERSSLGPEGSSPV